MKRCFSIALILALLGTSIVLPSFAEELEIVSEEISAPVEEADLAEPIDISDFLFEDIEEAPVQDFSDPDAAAAFEESPIDNFVQNALINADEAGEEAPAATSITLSHSKLRIGVNEKFRGLVVSSLPEGSALPAIQWRSSNTNIAKVSKKGVITGIKRGSVTIYAKMSGSKEEVSCRVRVSQAPKEVILPASSLSLSPGMTYQINATVPEHYASGVFTFKSSKPQVATVDDNGFVTAVAKGSTVITVRAYNGVKAKLKVSVKPAPAAVVFPCSILPLAVGQAYSLKARALREDGKDAVTVITYAVDDSSLDPGCITLNEKTGKVKGVRRGSAIIRGTTHNGVVGYCEVEVDIAPAAVSLNYSSASIGIGEVYVDLLATLTPPKGESTCAQSIKWTTSNKAVATVDSFTGAVTGVKTGTCVIKAKITGDLYAECKVHVLKAPKKSKISISPSNGSLKVGQTGQYKITYSSGYGGSLSYESSDTSIATIDNSGIVTAVSPGNAVITVTTYNGIQKTANLEINSDKEEDDPDDSKSGNDEKIQYLLGIARQKLGKPYVYGSFGPNSFDCSGFVYWCYKQIGIKLKDSAYKQGYDDRYKKIAYADLRPGDVVVFDTVKDSDLSDHTGIFLGNGEFIHASSSGGKVIISNFTDYYKRNFSWGRRILD